jgi:glucose dehydrogenase
MRSKWIVSALGSAALAFALAPSVLSQAPAAEPAAADWPTYRHDHAGTGYSPLAQINSQNVATLAEAWSYSLQPVTPAASGRGGAAGVNSQATPIVVGGRMYLPAADRIVALDPATGRELWRHVVDGAGAPSRRGVSYWAGDSSVPARILFTAGRRLMALAAATGATEAGFGDAGTVDMVVPYNSVPLVYKNVVVVGANSPPGANGGIGNARAYDARTGAKLWEFNSVPQPGEVGHDTWEGDSWKNRLGVNAWPFFFTLDEQRGLLFIPLASPIGGNYGGDRKGANLFGNSVVAVDVLTGKYRWHFQTIHHDLWDHDPPAPPSLFEINRDGRAVPGLALTTKSGYLYLLNRETGQPLFGVEERPVPKSDVPGEMAFPTQPVPVAPPALARVRYSDSDLVAASDTTPEHAAACAELVAKAGGVQNAGPFTPFMYRGEGMTTKTTLVFPGGLGGANWGGTAFDRNTGFVLIVTQDDGALGWMEKTAAGSPAPYDKGFPGRRTFDVEIGGRVWPCQKPPWGQLTAVNASTGAIAWQRPLGVTDQLPEGKQNTGRPALAGPIVTAGGLLFVASTDDNRFRALDVNNGRQLWETKLERRGNADPMTYRSAGGRQYVAIVATEKVLVYALP